MQTILIQSCPSCRRQRARASVVMPHSAASPSRKTAALRRSQAAGRQSSPAQTRQTKERPCCPLRKKWAAPSTKASDAPASAIRPFHLPFWGQGRGVASACMILFILSSCMSPRLRAGWLVAHPPSYSTSFPQWRDSPILPQFPQPGCARSHTTMSGLLLAVDVADLVPVCRKTAATFAGNVSAPRKTICPCPSTSPDAAERPAPRGARRKGRAGTLYTPPKARHSGRI